GINEKRELIHPLKNFHSSYREKRRLNSVTRNLSSTQATICTISSDHQQTKTKRKNNVASRIFYKKIMKYSILNGILRRIVAITE
ncbi:hypothetical protein L9F63_002132, partial [Diploptera punctata]